MLRSRTNRLISIAIFLSSLTAVAQETSSGVPENRFNHLRHGINASEWFAQRSNYSPEFLRTYTTHDDIVQMHRLGFDHVRLSIDPQPLWNEGQPDSLRQGDFLKQLDIAVDDMLANGLAVIIDVHPSDEFKRRLVSDDHQAVAKFADFWRALARHYATRDPELVLFEVLNEPEFEDAARWYGVQSQLLASIREAAPKHTIIVAGGNWSDLYDLLAIEPYADRNVIYNFHFYSPHIFTHQGATWSVNSWHHLHGIPYPSSPDAVRPTLPQGIDARAQYDLLQYGLDRWDAERIRADMTFAAQWAKQHGVRLTCNEFGAFREHSDPKARAQWVHDVRIALEENGIGWTMWDYRGGFGVVSKQPDGKALPDVAIVDALGLHPQS